MGHSPHIAHSLYRWGCLFLSGDSVSVSLPRIVRRERRKKFRMRWKLMKGRRKKMNSAKPCHKSSRVMYSKLTYWIRQKYSICLVNPFYCTRTLFFCHDKNNILSLCHLSLGFSIRPWVKSSHVQPETQLSNQINILPLKHYTNPMCCKPGGFHKTFQLIYRRVNY